MKPSVAVLGLCIALAAGVCPAGEPAAVPPSSLSPEASPPELPLEFRRIFAPADRQQDWPFEPQRYFPVDPQEFDEMVERVNAAARIRQFSSAATVSESLYEARLSGESLVAGHASLDVAHWADSPATMRLQPFGLATGQMSWADKDGQPARSGLGPGGVLSVAVAEPGRLEFDWSLRGRRDPSGVVEFALAVPPCPTIRWLIELPKDLVPVVEHGIVQIDRELSAASRRWAIDVGGHNLNQLRIVNTGASQRPQQLPRVRQLLLYNFAPKGLDLNCRLQLDIQGEPVRQVALTLAPELRLVAAEYGDKPVPWSLLSSEPGKPGRVVVELPEPIQGIGRELRLSAIGQIVLDRPWSLPGIRPEGLFWQQTSATLYVPKPLALRRLTPVAARLSRQIGSLPFPRVGESFDLQYFSQDAGAEVVIARSEAPIRLDTGLSIRLAGGGVTSSLTGRFRLDEGEQFEVVGQVAPQWNVDAVEAEPADAIDDWVVGKTSDGARTLTVRLAKALGPSRPIMLKVSGRRLHSPLGRPRRVAELVPVEFAASLVGRQLISIRPEDPYQLKLSGDEGLARVELASLDPATRQLLADPDDGPIFERSAAANELMVSLEARRPAYTAAIRAEAAASGDSLLESYRIHCVPDSTQVDRVVVRLRPAGSGPLRWTLGPGDTARLIRSSATKPPASGLPAENWEITLRPPRTGEFDLQAERASDFNGRRPLSLLAVPEAAAQEAVVEISSRDAGGVLVDRSSLVPRLPPTGGDDGAAIRRAEYRYDPVRDTAADAIAPTVARAQAAAPLSAWAWHLELESWYEPRGNVRHTATYQLETAGCDRLAVTLPADTDMEGVRAWVDAVPVEPRWLDGPSGRRIELALPRGRRFPAASIGFSTAEPPLKLAESLNPPRLEAAIPVLGEQWTVWLPPGYEVARLERPSPGDSALAGWWPRRLIAALARPVDQRPFDPLQTESWTALAADDQEAPAMVEDALRAASLARQTPPATWGELLSDNALERLLSELPDDHAGMALLVDRVALARHGIFPHTALAVDRNSLSTDPLAFYFAAGLAVVAHPRAILVTTDEEIAARRSELRPASGGLVWQVSAGPLWQRIDEAVDRQRLSRFVNGSSWATEPAEAMSPWLPRHEGAEPAADTLGWSAFTIRQTAAPVVVYWATAIDALKWSALLAGAAFGFALLRSKTVPTVLVAGLLGMAVLVVGNPLSIVFSGALLGVLGGFVLGLVWPARRPKDGPTVAGREARRAAALALLVPTVWWGSSGMAVAQEATAARASAHRVFVPTDGEGNPTGDKYWIPEVLYDELHRRVADLSANLDAWLLQSAVYRGALVRQSSQERLALEELTATFHLEVLDESEPVRLPLAGFQPLVVADRIYLDGRLLDARWEENGNVLVFDGEGLKGLRRLEFQLRPALVSEGSSAGFDLAIPQLAEARLELGLPPDAPKIDVPTATGALVRRSDPSRLVAELGPATMLTVRWQAESPPDVEELLWMKVEPDRVVLDARFRYRAASRLLGECVLLVDPRLQREGALESDVGQLSESPGEPLSANSFSLLRLKFDPPVAGQVVIGGRFILRDTSGIGHLRLPYLRSQDARVNKRWLAVSVDSTLLNDLGSREGVEPIAVPVFSTAWGDTAEQPLFAYSLASESPMWHIVTRPSPPRTTAAQTLAVSYDSRMARLDYDARLETVSGRRFQYQLAGPPGLEVEAVSVTEGDSERLARWSSDPDGTISVFLSAAVTGVHKLSLRGRLPLADSSSGPLPLLELHGAERDSQAIHQDSYEVHLYRQPSVQLAVEQAIGLVDNVNPTVSQDTQDRGRLLKSYRVEAGGAPRATVSVAPNECQFAVDQTTLLEQESGTWTARTDIRLKIVSGLLDELRLTTPLNWKPEKLDPYALVRETTSPGDTLHRFVIRPLSATQGEYRLTLSGRMTLAAGDPVAVPQIVVEGARQTSHLVVLPTQAELQTVAWETSGLRAVELPAGIALPPVAPETFIAYQATRPSFQAVLKPSAGVSQVHLADVRVRCRADGTYEGVADFDLEAVRLPECTLRLGPGARLIQTAVSGVPQTPESREGGWRVALAPTLLPQRLTVLFSGQLAPADSRGWREIPAPMLDGLPVRQTLWSVAWPDSPARTAAGGLEPVAAWDQQMVRLRSLTSLVDMAKNVSTGDSSQVVEWYGRWIRQWSQARHEFRRLSIRTGRSEQAVLDELEPLDEQHAEASSRLGTAEQLNVALAETPIALEAAALWEAGNADPAGVVRVRTSEGGGRFHFVDRRSGSVAGLGWALVSWSLAAAVAAVVLPIQIRSGFYLRWPQASAVAIGLAWWLWLWPSALGWIVVALALAASIQSGWRLRHRAAPSGSHADMPL